MKSRGVTMRARGPLELIDLGFVLVRDHASPILRAGGPALALAAGFALLGWLYWPPLGLLLALLGGRVAQAPIVTALGAISSGGSPPRPRRLADAALLLRTGLVPGLICTLALVAGPLAAFVWRRLTYLPEVTLLEGDVQVTQRSATLADALGAPTWGVRFGLVGMELWAAIAAEASGQAIVDGIFQLGAPFGSLLEGDVTPFLLVGVLIAQPWCCAVRLVAYLDARTRAEALDALFDLRTAVAAWSER